MGFTWETPEEMDLALARRLRGIRKRRGLTQQQLSEKSNVSFGSIKRFESTGQISLDFSDLPDQTCRGAGLRRRHPAAVCGCDVQFH